MTMLERIDKVCESCPLKGKSNFRLSGKLWGDGKIENVRLIILGEAPGKEEDVRGEIFVGRSGKLLDQTIKNLCQFDKYGIYVTNVVKCAPRSKKGGKIRTPTPEEIECCRQVLLEELKCFPNDAIIMPLGGSALASVLGMKDVSKHVGRLIENRSVKGDPDKVKRRFLINFHPAYVLRNGGKVQQFYRTFAYANGILVGQDEIDYAVLSPQSAKEVLESLISSSGSFFFADIESRSLHTEQREDGLVIGIALASPSMEKVFYIPFYSNDENYQVTEVDRAVYRKLLRELFAKKAVVGHNLKFDLQQLVVDGYVEDFKIHADTYIQAHLVYNVTLGSLGLKSLASNLFFVEDWEAELKKSKKKVKDYSDYPTEVLGKYACYDIYYTKKLYNHLSEKIKPREGYQKIEDYYKLIEEEMTLIELGGLTIDFNYLEQVKDQIELKQRDILIELKALEGVKEGFNLNSSQQIAGVLAYYKTTTGKETDGGAMSVDKASLESLLKKEDTPEQVKKFISLILQYRDLEKARSTYLEGLYQYQVNKSNLCRIPFKLCGTKTGRLSSAFHVMPSRGNKKYLKRLITSHFDNGCIVSFDFSQFEPRVLAAFSQDEVLKQAYVEGYDIYRFLGGKVFNCKPEEITKQQRTIMKAIVLGIIYGKTAGSIAEDLGITQKDAENLIDTFMTSFPKVKAWMKKQHKELRQKRGVVTPLGRYIPIPEIESKSKYKIFEAERKSQNYPIQSTASELGLIFFSWFSRELREEGYQSACRASVHDSLIIDTPANEAFNVIVKAKQMMEKEYPSRFDFLSGVPLKIDVAIGTSWGGSLEVESFNTETKTVVVSGWRWDLKQLCNRCGFQVEEIEDIWIDEDELIEFYPFSSPKKVKAKVKL